MAEREGGDNGIAIGIDIGTSYSRVAVLRGRGRVEVIPNDHGNLHTRSYVAFTRTQRLIGDGAFDQAYNNAPNTVFCAKRFIGHKINELIQSDMDHWPFKVEQGVARKPMIAVNYKGENIFFSAEEILSMELIKMKRIAEAFVGSTVKNAVISVPAHFNNLQRKAMRDAGEIAGLNVMQIINEPTAAAIAYGFTPHRDMNRLRKVLIFDFGGGALDVSLLELRQGHYKVIATAGDPHLGGEDFDNRLVNHFADEFNRQTSIDILGLGHQRPLRRLRTACEKAKKILSTNIQTTIEVFSLWKDIDFSSSITREQFEDLNIDLLCNCLTPINKCLGDAGMEKDYVDEVVLVGGSTRIPRVRQILQEFFNRNELYMGINPDEAVACGAAIQASIISDANKNGGDFFLVDVMPHSLWFETTGKSMPEFIPKNASIPTTKKEVFTTFVDDQEELVMNVYEEWGAQVAANRLLGTFKLHNIPPASRGVPQITVSFDINYDGILHITAVCDINGQESTITITNRTDRHRTEEVAEMVQRAEMFEKEDKKLEEIMLVRVKFEDYVSTIMKTILDDDEDRKLISPDDKKKMEDAIERTQNELVGIVELTDKLEELKNKCDPIIELTDKLKELKNICDPIIDRMMHQKSLPKAHDPNLTEELQEQAVAKSELEYFCKEMKKLMEDDEISSILGADDKKKIEDTLKQSFRWLEQNELAGADELKAKLKEVQDICDPIIQRAYGEGYE